jgi:hypothetical protein
MPSLGTDRADSGHRGAPVRRHSRERGRCEGVFWRPFRPKDAARFMLAAERYERRGRAKGERSGPLGGVALEVLRELIRLVDYRTGRLEPSIATLQVRARRSRDAVVRALANLRSHGFLDWLRRWEPTGSLDGPKVKQATNAYRLVLPPAAERLLGAIDGPCPEPEDFETARAAKAAALRAMVDALPLDEQAEAAGATGRMKRSLDLLGAAVMKRRSVSPPADQKPAPVDIKAMTGVGLRPTNFLKV